MKRKWNWPIWVGFVVIVAGLFSYGFFVRFPIDARFSMGESFAFWNWGCVVDSRLCSARSAGRRFIAERFSARSSQRLLCLLSRFSATKSSTSCDRCRPQLARRALGKRRLTFYYWIKMENLLASAICFPTQEVSC